MLHNSFVLRLGVVVSKSWLTNEPILDKFIVNRIEKECSILKFWCIVRIDLIYVTTCPHVTEIVLLLSKSGHP